MKIAKDTMKTKKWVRVRVRIVHVLVHVKDFNLSNVFEEGPKQRYSLERVYNRMYCLI